VIAGKRALLWVYMGQSFEVGLTLWKVFLIFNAILQWELTIGPPWLEREKQIHVTPLPVPTGINTILGRTEMKVPLEGERRIPGM
jgi:hypothetical protein